MSDVAQTVAHRQPYKDHMPARRAGPTFGKNTMLQHTLTMHLRLRTLVHCMGLAGLTLASGAALSQSQGYFYGGISAGQAQSQMHEDVTAASALGGSATVNSFTREPNSNSYRVFGGYQLNPNFALEAGYFNLGKSRFNANTTPAGTLNGEYLVEGLNMDLVGTAPLGDRWSVIGRLGVQYANSKTNLLTSGAAAVTDSGPSKREANLKVGLGLQYEINRGLFLRGEAERYRVNDGLDNHGEVNVLTLGLVIPFGRPAETRVAAAPAYVPPAPAPIPEPVVAPVVAAPAPVVVAVVEPVVVPPVPQRVQFSADSLFTFDRATLGPAGETALATFGQQLQGTEFDSITVEGHTDRLGTSAYNQRLSLQRAESVKAYLVTSLAVPQDKVKAVGMGESSPVTKATDCPGKKATAATIACLQPDRRVEVDVVGKR